jgi:hypothetical protein
MLHEHWEGKSIDHPEVRQLFTREHLLTSDWYAARLKARQSIDRQLWRRHANSLDRFLKHASHVEEADRLGIAGKLARVRKTLEQIEAPSHLQNLAGTLGAEPICRYVQTTRQETRD